MLQKRRIVFYNGKIITVDDDFSIAEAVVIEGNTITKVGPSEDILKQVDADSECIDLKGKCVIPGIIDTHPHFIHASIRKASQVPLDGLMSLDAIKSRIGEEVAKKSSGEWIVASPLGDPPYFFTIPEKLDEKRWPTCTDIDEVSPENPVYIAAPSNIVPYTAILNSLGLKQMGVTGETPTDYKGVMIMKDSKTGNPNGQIRGMQAMYNASPFYLHLQSLLPKPSLNEQLMGLKNGIREYNASGVTTIYEGHYVGPEHLDRCKTLLSGNELSMRIGFAHELSGKKPIKEIEDDIKVFVQEEGARLSSNVLKTGGITVSLDGPISHGLALMHEPYLGPYGNPTTGIQIIKTEKLHQVALLAAKYNLRFNVCICGGDKAADITLQVFEEVNREIPITDKRWVIQHFNFPTREHIEKCKALGIFVSVCTNFEWGFGTEVYVNRFGKDFARNAIPLRLWLDAGVPISQSTDYGPYQPMFTLWQSLKRVHGLSGDSYAGPDQKITREEALRMYTINGARFLYWEDKLGSIEPGKLADLVVLDNDILACDENEIKHTKIIMTMFDGKVVYENKHATR